MFWSARSCRTNSRHGAILIFCLVFSSTDALVHSSVQGRAMRRQGVDVGRSMREIKHTALGALRGGAAEGIVQTFFAHAETVMRFVRQWASVLGFLVLLCGLCPHLPRDFLDCWYRLAIGGFGVSVALVVMAVPQTIKMSAGVLPPPTPEHILGILTNALPMQTLFKMVQYFSLRNIKRALDSVSWMPYKSLNTILSYGLTATVLQCAAYNNVCYHVYTYHGRENLIFHKYDRDATGTITAMKIAAALGDCKKTEKREDIQKVLRRFKSKRRDGSIGLEEFKMLVEQCDDLHASHVVSARHKMSHFLHNNVLPGILFSFLRECFSTGTGLVLSPHVRKALDPLIGKWPPVAAKIVSGILAGLCCSFMTQSLHNNALRAANIYQYSGELPTTVQVLQQTWAELGVQMFYLNAQKRVLSTATATTVLGLVDVFK